MQFSGDIWKYYSGSFWTSGPPAGSAPASPLSQGLSQQRAVTPHSCPLRALFLSLSAASLTAARLVDPGQPIFPTCKCDGRFFCLQLMFGFHPLPWSEECFCGMCRGIDLPGHLPGLQQIVTSQLQIYQAKCFLSWALREATYGCFLLFWATMQVCWVCAKGSYFQLQYCLSSVFVSSEQPVEQTSSSASPSVGPGTSKCDQKEVCLTDLLPGSRWSLSTQLVVGLGLPHNAHLHTHVPVCVSCKIVQSFTYI